MKGNREDARTINSALDRMKLKIRDIYHTLAEEERSFTADVIKQIYLGKKQKERTVLEVFGQHNEQMQVRDFSCQSFLIRS